MQFVNFGLRSVLSGDGPARRLVLALVLELVALFLGWGRGKERPGVSLSRYSQRWDEKYSLLWTDLGSCSAGNKKVGRVSLEH